MASPFGDRMTIAPDWRDWNRQLPSGPPQPTRDVCRSRDSQPRKCSLLHFAATSPWNTAEAGYRERRLATTWKQSQRSCQAVVWLSELNFGGPAFFGLERASGSVG